MISHESFSDSLYADQVRIAERERAAFIEAVTQMYGLEEAMLAERDWLDESDLMDSPPRSTSRDWRAVTIAASARLAERKDAGHHHPAQAPASDVKAESIPSSNGFATGGCDLI